MTHYHIDYGMGEPFVELRRESLGNAVNDYFNIIHGFILKTNTDEEKEAKEEITKALMSDSDMMSTTKINDFIEVSIYSCEEEEPCIMPIDN